MKLNVSFGIVGIYNSVKRFLLISIFAVFALCQFCEAWEGRVVKVFDGDTIEVLRGRSTERIRLYGIDCPERGQDFGERARQFTSRMVFGKNVEVIPEDRDQFGRAVSWVRVGNSSLNHALVKEGLAWHYKRYAGQENELAELEANARKQKVGLWSHKNPTAPWEFRRRQER
jgi:endonuclease YncB( thermonuclease family)